jgi:ABC-type sugar transport system ATPase subunit
MTPRPVLRVEAVFKRFAESQALADVSFDLRAGECLALLGQNGAGKSTLVKILCGLHRSDRGRIEMFGERVTFANMRDARRAGVVVVPQELRVVPQLTVAENVMLGHLPSRWLLGVLPMLDRSALRRSATAALELLGVRYEPDRLASSLSFAERQLLVIARALGHDARILILDEPTASLENREVEQLLAVLRRLKQQGVALIYVSHRLHEIESIADAAVVLRDGRVVSRMTAPGFDHVAILHAMTGRSPIENAGARMPNGRGIEAIRLSLGNRQLICHRGEVVGLAGLLGSGADAAVRDAFGHDGSTIRHAIGRGTGFVPSERAKALVPILSVRDNIVLPHLGRFRTAFGRDEQRIDAVVDNMMELLDIRPRQPELPVCQLSGGNQQKVALARWFAGRLELLLLDEPTQGVDVAAKAEIHAKIARFAAQGGAVVMASSDTPELLALSHTVYAIRRGRLVGAMARGDGFTEHRLEEILGS